MSRKRLEIRSRVCTVVQYAVLEAMTRVEKRKIRPPPRKYKMDKDIQTPPWIDDYVAELSCCAQSERNRLTEFCWGNTGSLSFFTHTHRHSNKFFHLAYRSQYGRIWNIYGSKRVVSRPDVPFSGIVDDKSCLRVQIPKKTFFGTIQCKTYYRESSP